MFFSRLATAAVFAAALAIAPTAFATLRDDTCENALVKIDWQAKPKNILARVVRNVSNVAVQDIGSFGKYVSSVERIKGVLDPELVETFEPKVKVHVQDTFQAFEDQLNTIPDGTILWLKLGTSERDHEILVGRKSAGGFLIVARGTRRYRVKPNWVHVMDFAVRPVDHRLLAEALGEELPKPKAHRQNVQINLGQGRSIIQTFLRFTGSGTQVSLITNRDRAFSGILVGHRSPAIVSTEDIPNFRRVEFAKNSWLEVEVGDIVYKSTGALASRQELFSDFPPHFTAAEVAKTTPPNVIGSTISSGEIVTFGFRYGNKPGPARESFEFISGYLVSMQPLTLLTVVDDGIVAPDHMRIKLKYVVVPTPGSTTWIRQGIQQNPRVFFLTHLYDETPSGIGFYAFDRFSTDGTPLRDDSVDDKNEFNPDGLTGELHVALLNTFVPYGPDPDQLYSRHHFGSAREHYVRYDGVRNEAGRIDEEILVVLNQQTPTATHGGKHYWFEIYNVGEIDPTSILKRLRDAEIKVHHTIDFTLGRDLSTRNWRLYHHHGKAMYKDQITAKADAELLRDLLFEGRGDIKYEVSR